MKVNELMVGDLVNMGNPVTDELVPTKIENIYGEEINCKTGHTSDDVPTIIYGKWLRYAQPIPLTEEILVKNGFKKRYFDYDFSYDLYEDDNVSFVRLYDHGEGVFFTETSGSDILIKYVHQLQRLLNLCNIDKEIIL